MVLMIDAGLRVGEVTQMSIANLYFTNKAVYTLDVSTAIAKGGRRRQIPLTIRAKWTLNRWKILAGYVETTCPTINAFPNHPTGDAITTRTVERIISSAALESIGIVCTPHMLRHTFATRLMKITDIRTVQELLGHKSVASTQIYTHVNDEDMLTAITDMETKTLLGSDSIPASDLASY